MDVGRLHRLANVASLTGSVLDLHVEALAATRALLSADAAAILDVGEGPGVRFEAWCGLSPDYRRLAAEYAPWPADAPDPAPVLVRDLREDDLGLERPELLAEGIRAVAYVPLLEEGRLVGALAAYWRARRELSASELQIA